MSINIPLNMMYVYLPYPSYIQKDETHYRTSPQ